MKEKTYFQWITVIAWSFTPLSQYAITKYLTICKVGNFPIQDATMAEDI